MKSDVWKKSILTRSSWLCWILTVVIFVFLSCATDVGYVEKIFPPGNEFVEPVDPAKDDSDQILTSYDQFPDSVRQKIEQLLPNGVVKAINHWGPFRYTLMKKFLENYSNQVYFYLNGRIEKIYFIDGDYMERPGLFFIKGTEKYISTAELPESVIQWTEQRTWQASKLNSWVVDSKIGPTYVLEVSGYQGKDTTAFAFRPDGALKTMGTVRRMHRGVPKFWTEEEIENLLAKYRSKYGVDQVISRIKKIPFDPSKGFRFAVFGDPQNHTDVLAAICKSISKKKMLFAIATGDLVEDIEPDQYNKYLFDTLDKHARFIFVPVIGNHDVGLDRLAQAHRAAFGENSLNYYFDYGNVRFVILDNVSRVIPFEEQLQNADQWLSQVPSDYYKFVFAHVPPGEIKKWAYHSMSGEKSRKFTSLMEKHKVDNIFMGHIHAYSTATYNGVNYTINGGSGGKIHKRYGPKGSAYHYLIVDVTSEGVKQQLVQIELKDK